MSTIVTLVPHLFLAYKVEVNVSPIRIGVQDCSIGTPMISGELTHEGGAITCTRNCTGVALNGVKLELLIKSST